MPSRPPRLVTVIGAALFLLYAALPLGSHWDGKDTGVACPPKPKR